MFDYTHNKGLWLFNTIFNSISFISCVSEGKHPGKNN